MLNATLLLRRVFVFRDLDKDSIMKEKLLELSKEELVDLLELSSKNIVAMDGVWFQTLSAWIRQWITMQKLGADILQPKHVA